LYEDDADDDKTRFYGFLIPIKEETLYSHIEFDSGKGNEKKLGYGLIPPEKWELMEYSFTPSKDSDDEKTKGFGKVSSDLECYEFCLNADDNYGPRPSYIKGEYGYG